MCTGVIFWSAEADAEQSSPVHVAHRAGSEATPPSSPVPPLLHMETDFNEEDYPTEVQDMYMYMYIKFNVHGRALCLEYRVAWVHTLVYIPSLSYNIVPLFMLMFSLSCHCQ